ncbi:5'-nucleotidase, lipoprotein e(P4) family [Marinomonas mediterranea]|jgi:5''-nucleotidase, lipoprotein e(P4) family|uniref:5'-nucleotidase, lipoprotein e(P4) family n=1 Tax=Marinomonas mediterranea (strain ATCC 700492 / JCM 21426 / NBRC 103028 / MMB-1) TaxID=717774 RepID=F2JXR0_MARM1|nr:5'-nucleotidase, lipoprotein e(P4) family [Marinomonas mediterranea]ADZ93058.1 5'-nucleotidase, lipoprotein e(P4) family [Marinomonas mediterranea MMB-1]WCN10965.1 5'-nucleotidase, lipoprotein e(P4) family [Marinomonas mediterranea]WCN15027.1 5'-nucleotidase, lipoprotein e(P4) family [Marinomonas mediterranea]WCN19071.1 5'-nucleotidase, lipoprotein e(P4) family [Marinomonas mediterranea MMB-1]
MMNTVFRTFVLSSTLLLGSISLPSWADESTYTTKDLNEQLVLASVWMQNSGEFKALSYQAFNLAKMSLDDYLEQHKGSKKVAVVVDADETVIDNGAYEAWLVGKDFGYSSKTWAKWMEAAQATAMPGALDFLTYAEQKGVEIFYVTNRKMVGLEGTRKNLKALDFPFVDDAHLMLRDSTSNKEPRRQKILADFDIALLMGDNLNDFSADFKTKSLEGSYAAVEKNKALFGTKYIVLPNPTYGDWEGKVYKGNWGASAAEKDQMRKAHLTAWKPES